MKLLFTNIRQLVQVREEQTGFLKGDEMKELPVIQDAWLLVEDGKISDFGMMKHLPILPGVETIDASGRILLPGWIDSHTHLVYAGNREQEFIDRINGLSYEEIAAKGGGILNSAKKLQETSEDQLYHESSQRLEEVIRMGTTAIEIKSGYGLTKQAELKMLRVIRRLRQNYDLPIKATFLGAHAVPPEYHGSSEAYLNHIISEILPGVAEEKLADYVDIFCEKGYFNVRDTERMIQAGLEYGLPAKIHVNQFNSIGGIPVAVRNKARSVDHLECLDSEDISALRESATMAVALPSCSFFLGIPYTPARELLKSGLPLALASDYNPGSTPSGNMNFVVSLACIKMKMNPEEAINAATINAAYAMDLNDTHGSITKGKAANLILTERISSYGFLPYSFGANHIAAVFINGKQI